MDELDARIEGLIQQLCRDGLLNDQFQQLMQLEDDSNPDFVRKLQKLTVKLNTSKTEFAEVDALVHQFKGSSASFGAQALAMLCVQMRQACQEQDQSRCQILLREAELSFGALQSKLQTFLQLEEERKRLAAGQR